MTPYAAPNTPAEEAYNDALCTTRVRIEHCNGQIKKRFPCLKLGMRVQPERASKYVMACADKLTLHSLPLSEKGGELLVSRRGAGHFVASEYGPYPGCFLWLKKERCLAAHQKKCAAKNPLDQLGAARVSNRHPPK